MKVGDLVKVDCASRDIEYLHAVYDAIIDRTGIIIEFQPERMNSYRVYWGTRPSTIEGIAFSIKNGSMWMRDEHITTVG